MTRIKCECGIVFLGQEDKEDTCPDCLKKLINPKEHITCNECHKDSYNVENIKELECFYCGSTNVGITETKE